jgi:glycosyltransferase involved in cell wall biosynthesis
MNKELVSIIIPTYNEEKTLPRLLKSIKKQKSFLYEIIVADADSKDKTKNIAKRFNCKIIKGGLPAKGRNNGAKVSRGNILIFLDADTELPENFLINSISEFKKRKLDLAGVSIIPNNKNIIDHFYHWLYNTWQKLIQKIDPHISGACIIIKKDSFKKLGGFNEKLKIAEDQELARSSKKLKMKFGILHTHILLDMRRLEKEGRIKYGIKMLAILFIRYFGKIEKSKIKYDLKNYRT